MTALSKDRPLERAAYRASDEAWSKAVRIARELDRVLDGDLPMREAVSRAAVELRLSTRQVYNHLARYREDRRVSSLLPRTNGARRARISASVEAIISDTLRKMWLQPEQPDLAPIVDEIRARGVDIPIVPGIMPIASFSKLARFSDACGAELPRWMRRKFEGLGDDTDAIRAFGLDVVTELCERLLAGGAPGLHFYSMNQSALTLEICQRLKIG